MNINSISEKLLKLDSSKGMIREAAIAEVDNLIQAAVGGDQSALETIYSLLPDGADIVQVLGSGTFKEDLAEKYAEASQLFVEKDAAKKKKKSKLREVEERILHYCTKPRVSSSVIELFPSRPFNILAIMENLKHKGALILAANHWVTNVENRDFVPTMTLTAEHKAGQFESKTAEMWSYSDVESKKRLLARAKIKAADKYAVEPWDFLPMWVKKSVVYVHENPAVSIAEKKTADEDSGQWDDVCECGHDLHEHDEDKCLECDCVGFDQVVEASNKEADDTPATINVNEQSQMQQVEGAEEKEATGEADQDYDKEFFDKIVEQLDSAGFPGATHREFDKYQGVYLKVPGVDKFWIGDMFSTGKKAPGSRPGGSFSYEKGTMTDHVIFSPEKDTETQIEVLDMGGNVNAGSLIDYCEDVKGGKSKESSKEAETGEVKVGYSKKDYIQFAELVKRFPSTIDKATLIDEFINLFKGENPNFDAGRFKQYIEKKAETGEVKKDVPMEITHIQDLDTGEKITDPKQISEGIEAGMDYIVSFKREGKEEQALLSSLDKSKLKVADENSSVGKVSPKDILEMVYDKIMENHQHEQLDTEHVEDQELNLDEMSISFKYHGIPVKLSLSPETTH